MVVKFEKTDERQLNDLTTARIYRTNLDLRLHLQQGLAEALSIVSLRREEILKLSDMIEENLKADRIDLGEVPSQYLPTLQRVGGMGAVWKASAIMAEGKVLRIEFAPSGP